MIIFSTSRFEFLKNKILNKTLFEDGQLIRKIFADGESYLRIGSAVKNKDVLILGGTITDSEILEMYDLGCAIAKFQAKSISFIIPFFGYSTMEIKNLEGEVVKAKTRARLLSSIPKAYQGNRVFLLDLHSEGIVHYFEGDLTTHHLSATGEILKHIQKLNLNNFVLAAPDQGRAKQVQKMADRLQVDSAFISKRRYPDGRVVAQAANADVAGRTVIIYDDMIRSGTSILEAVRVYESAGAREIYIYTTHGVFCGDARSKLCQPAIIKKIVYTDSYSDQKNKTDKEEIVSIDDLIIEHLKGFL